ncbi:hypothetical protein TRFO_27843 [Tritrichomonas foetus]|uniref:USP domain-containing protein n=1 Tax=Tritrichomonas foetus TaxID=1144522 RepID=A0A1J4K1G9_9EUKA|nr:hypothetical protein TRFO_27843 [Tritrichomonas foetus]|eukprot:OHT04632.1 hypothetical protein TRFO_27843 [Tritrichomonas foetus]
MHFTFVISIFGDKGQISLIMISMNQAKWLSDLSDAANGIKHLPDFFDRLKECFEAILSYQKLPSPFTMSPDSFASSIIIKTVKPILSCKKLRTEQLEIIIEYFEILLDYSQISIDCNFKEFFNIPIEILTTTSNIATNYNQEYFQPLYQFIANHSMFEKYINALENQDIKDIKHVKSLAILLLPALNYQKKFETRKICQLFTQTVENMISEDFRGTSAQTVFEILDILLTRSLSKEIFLSWLGIINKYLNSEHFDKQLISLKYILKVIDTSKYSKYTIKWIYTKIDILSKFPIHPEFSPLIAEIYAFLSESKYVMTKPLTDLWNLNAVQSDSDLNLLFSMFITISTKISTASIEYFSKLILDPAKITSSYLHFLGDIAKSFEKRNTKESCNIIKSIKKKLDEFSQTNSGLNQKMQSEILAIINELKAVNISKENFDKLVEYSLQKSDKLHLLCDSLDRQKITNRKTVENLFNAMIKFYPKEKQEMRKCINNILFKIIDNIKKTLSKTKTEEILALTSYDTIFELIERLISANYMKIKSFIDFSMEFANSKSAYISSSFVELIDKLFKIDTVTELPFENEELLWKLSLMPSSNQEKIQSILIRIYQSNDGKILSDHKMMDVFFNNWKNYFEQFSNKVSSESSLIILLSNFIKKIETFFYIERKQHKPLSDNEKITVNINETQLFVDPDVTVYSLLMNIKGNDYSQYSLKQRSNILNGNETVQSIAGHSKDIQLKLIEREIEPVRFRKIMPGVVFLNSTAFSALFNSLKKDCEEAKKLLNYLPTDPNTIKEIQSFDETTNYSNFFPIDFPNIFLYKFESLIQFYHNAMNKISIKCIEFLMDYGLLIPKSDLISGIYELILKYPIQSKIIEEKKLISLLKSLTLCLKNLNNLQPALISGLNYGYKFEKDQFTMPDQYKHLVNDLLNCKNEEVRKEADYFLYRLRIPFSFYTEVATMESSAKFYSSLGDHIEGNDKNVKNLLLKILENGNEEAGHLYCINKFIQKENFSKTELKTISSLILTKYFQINDIDRGKDVFQEASKIIIEIAPSISSISKYFIKLKIKKPEWRINGDTFTLKSDKFVGLENLGATCFLNSVTQQLFAITGFRNLLFSYSGDDQLTLQFQNLFSRLRFSILRSETTQSFIDHFIWDDGEKLSPSRQQDCCEYLLKLLDKLEKELTAEKLNHLFQGKISNKIESVKDGKLLSQQYESYMVLPLEVAKCQNLQESFDMFSEIEYMTGENGYKDENGVKVDAKRYSEIVEYPNYLIIHLKRFQYDYTTWKRYKLTHQYEFPVKLEKNHQKYDLTGIIIHHGSAEYGHYFSYIKTEDEWYCFNDSCVSKSSLQVALDSGKNDGYLLFYTHLSEPETINEELKLQVDGINNGINIKRLLCSTQFYKIMKRFMESENNYCVQASLHYIYNILPFCSLAEKAQKFIPLINDAMKSNHDSFKSVGLLVNCNSLLGCPIDNYRKMIKTLTQKCFFEFPGKTFFSKLIELLDDVPEFQINFDDYFEILHAILNSTKKYKISSSKMENVFIKIFDKIVQKNLPKMIFNNLLFILSKCKFSEEFIDFVEQNKIFGYLFMSKTRLAAIEYFARNIPDVVEILEDQKKSFPKSSNKFDNILSILNNSDSDSSCHYEVD